MGALNLTGSPLKDDSDIDSLINHSIASKISTFTPWKDNEEMYTGVDIGVAREIINNLNVQTFPGGTSGWVFVLCKDQFNGTDKTTTFLLSSHIDPKNHVRGIGNYHGVVKNENKMMKNLINRHFSFIAPNTKLNSTLESVFELTPDMSLRFVNSNTGITPSFSHINESSDVVLKQRVQIGHSHILCDDFWSQIQLLNMIKNDIVNFRNSSVDGTLYDPNYNYGSNDMTFEILQEKVKEILSEINVIEEEADGVADDGLEAVIRRARSRSLPEVTDQLWDLLKFTNSYGDLKKILTFIFQSSIRQNIVNVPRNNNRMSELIRELSLQRLAIPHLVGTEPLELLLEIGIEKLMKDYEYILAESHICKLKDMEFGGKSQNKGADSRLSVRKSLAAAAAVDLNVSSRKTILKGSFDSDDELELGVRNSRFVERDVESNISKLAKLHLVVEHLLLIQNNLTMDNDYPSIVKRLFAKPLISFEDLQNEKYDKFEIAINDKKVIHLVENLVPNAQKIVLHSQNNMKSVENVFYFNIEQIVPVLAQKEKENEAIDKPGDSFHFISYTTLVSKF